MGKRKKSWAEIKSTKTAEEWRRINRAYGYRHRLKTQLQLKGADLVQQIQNYRLIENPGPADMLLDEVQKVLRLPYCWGQEAYDHAKARLEEIAQDIKNIRRKVTPQKSRLANMITMALLNAGDSEYVKATCVVGVLEHLAKNLSIEQVENLEQSKTNFFLTLTRTYDGYYPDWFLRYLFEILLLLVSEEDLQILGGWIAEEKTKDQHRDNLLAMIDMTEEEEE